jgi:hypothetical protein
MAWLGIIVPWGVYYAVQLFRGAAEPYELSSIFSTPLGTMMVIILLVGVVPIAVAIAVAHHSKLSYCEACIGRGGRIGGYSLALRFILGPLLGL